MRKIKANKKDVEKKQKKVATLMQDLLNYHFKLHDEKKVLETVAELAEIKPDDPVAAEALKLYLSKHCVSYAKLKKCWGKYVNNTVGSSRYKNIRVKTSDGIPVYSYTQFRKYGFCSYWNEFERICKKKKISIIKMKKIYKGIKGVPFVYEV